MRIRMFAAVLAAISLMGGILWANGTSEQEGASADLVEITQLAWDRGTVPTDQGTIEENWWTRYVNEQVAPLGFKVRFVPVPRAQETQKLPLMLASGEAPDLCFTYDKNLLNLYVKNQALVDFTDMLPQYGDNILRVSTQQDLDAGKINGRQYTFVCKSNGVADTTFIRKDWLDKLGLDIPTSVEEFYKVLQAFRDNDPGQAGDRLVPFALQGGPNLSFSLWQSVLLPGFLKEAPSGEKLVTPPQLWPEAKEAIRFMNKLYNEDLLDEFIIDKDGAIFKQKVIRGEIGAFISYGHWPYHAAYGSIYQKLREHDPHAELVSITPWKEESSKEYYYNVIRNTPYLYHFFSPKNTEHPEEVLKYLNWMASEEGYKVATLGLDGEDYTMVDGTPTPMDNKQYAARVSWIEPQYMAYMKPFSSAGEEDLYLKNASKTYPDDLRDQFIRESYPVSRLRYSAPPLNLSTPVADKYRNALEKKWEEAMARMVIAAPGEFSSLFDEAIRKYKAEGGEEMVREAVDVFHRQYGD